MKVLGVIVLVIVVIVAVANTGGSDEPDAKATPGNNAPTTYPSDAEQKAKELPGSDALQANPVYQRVYRKITHSTDCVGLQETFARNMDRYEMLDPLVRQEEGSPGEAMFAYANAADDRMREIGCYG